MAKLVSTDYDPIEIGTCDDDARMSSSNLYLIISSDRRQRAVLNPTQVLKLVAALLDTISEPPITPAGEEFQR